MKKYVLIVNSNQEISNKIHKNLSSANTEILCASSVSEAIPMLVKLEFCLIILDASISAQDDHQLLAAIRKLKVTPILILSSQFCQIER